MATTPTKNPIPSDSFVDARFNIEKVDEIISSDAMSYTDRFGVKRLTITGVRAMFSALSKTYDNIELARQAVASGEVPPNAFIWIRSESDLLIASEYQNTPNGLVATGKSSSSEKALEELSDRMPIVESPFLVGFAGKGGLYVGGVMPNGDILSGNSLSLSQLEIGNSAVKINKDGAYHTEHSIEKVSGSAPIRFEGKGGLYIDISNSGNDSDPVNHETYNIESRDSRNLSLSISKLLEKNVITQAINSNYNHFISYGQSLSTGAEGWPVFTSSAKPELGNLSFGGSQRSVTSFDSGSFTPAWNTAFYPLKPVVQAFSGAILSASQVAALPPGNQAAGESPIVAAVNAIRDRYLDSNGITSDESRLFVASDAGTPGATITQLSKGNQTGYYNRFTQLVTKTKALCDSQNKTYSVSGIFFMQGEWDYREVDTGVNDKAAYKLLLSKLISDLISDVMSITGQRKPPAIILSQTSGDSTNADNKISVGMAQLEFYQETAGVYMSVPAYHLPDKGSHLDPNGPRWIGQHWGKDAFPVIIERKGNLPLMPLKYTIFGNVIIGDFLVESPPLQFRKPFIALVETDFKDKGFTVRDSLGVINIISVDIAAQTVIKITLSREPVGICNVTYAEKTTYGGNGCLFDSGGAGSTDNYEYNIGTGQYPAANISSMVGRKYPLNKPCVAHNLIAEINK